MSQVRGSIPKKGIVLPHDLQQTLKKLLLTLSKGESIIERQRQKLAIINQFEPYAAFMRIDRDQNQLIGSVEILRFLRQVQLGLNQSRENGLEEASEADCYLIAKYFDSDEDGHLNYQDFMQVLMPCDNSQLRTLLAQRPNYPVKTNDYLGEDIEYHLTKLFEKEIALNRVVENIKQNLESNKSFDPLLAFQSIDDWNYGYIDKINLKRFLKNHNYVATKDEITSIIRRMDLDGDGRLSKQEFIVGLQPEEPYSKALKRKSSNYRQSMSRKNSQATLSNKENPYQFRHQDIIQLTNQQKDIIQNHALDRSFKEVISSRSPLKSRPVINSLHQNYPIISSKQMTPARSNKTPVSKVRLTLNQVKSSIRKDLESALSGKKFKDCKELTNNEKSSFNQKKVNKKSKSLLKSAIRKEHLTFEQQIEKINPQKINQNQIIASKILCNSKSSKKQGRTYNYNKSKAKQSDYEPINSSYLERVQNNNDQSLVTQSSLAKDSSHAKRKMSERIDQSSNSKKNHLNNDDPNFSRLLQSSVIREAKQSLFQSPISEQKGLNLSMFEYSSLRKKRYDCGSDECQYLGGGLMARQDYQKRENYVFGNEKLRNSQLIVDALRTMIECDKEIEQRKIELSLKEDFNLIDTFGIIDSRGKGYLTKEEFREQLSNLGLSLTHEEVKLLFSKYSSDQHNLKYSDFSIIFMPTDQNYAKILGTKKISIYNQNNRLKYQFSDRTKLKFLEIWRRLVDNEARIESHRQILHTTSRFDLRDAFKMLASNKDGLVHSTMIESHAYANEITISDVTLLKHLIVIQIKQFLCDSEIYLNENELQMILNRFDANRDGRISMSEFVNELLPKIPFNY